MKRRYAIAASVMLGILCIICLIVLLMPSNEQSGPTEQQVQTAVVEANKPEPEETVSPEPEPSETVPVETYVSPVDFTALQAGNPDIYAWLYVPNTEINYPVVQREDDTFYLDHDSEGNPAAEGAIFSESAYNGRDFEDPVTVLYGHHMKSGRMFGDLQSTYSDLETFSNCGQIVIYLPDKELHYSVFAAVPYDNRHILYTYDMENSRDYYNFLESIYGTRAVGAVFNSEQSATTEDQVLVLSTCLAGNSNKRYLVLAKLDKE